MKSIILFTDTKSHTRFTLVPKLVTFNNLERRNGRYYALSHNNANLV